MSKKLAERLVCAHLQREVELLIQARRLTKKYGNGVLALENFSPTFKGRICLSGGPSGRGKSTFLNLVIRRRP